MSERPLHEGKLDRAQTLSNVRSKATYEAISINPVTPVIGVEVEGVDMTSDVPDAQIEELNQALANHNVLFFRDQPELTAEQQIAFSCAQPAAHGHPLSSKSRTLLAAGTSSRRGSALAWPRPPAPPPKASPSRPIPTGPPHAAI